MKPTRPRPVRSVVIGVSDGLKVAAAPFARAPDIASDFADFLSGRFPGHDLRLRTETAPKQRILDDLDEAARSLDGDALLVVFYVGHGIAPTKDQQHHALALGDDLLTDRELARAFGRFRKGVERVLINASCYARGFFHVGPRSVFRLLGKLDARGMPSPWRRCLGKLTDALERVLVPDDEVAQELDIVRADAARRVMPRDRGVPMTCISAAGVTDLDGGVALGAYMTDFARAVRSAAERGKTYAELADEFDATAVAGGTFGVDSRPMRRLRHAVLSDVAAEPRKGGENALRVQGKRSERRPRVR